MGLFKFIFKLVGFLLTLIGLVVVMFFGCVALSTCQANEPFSLEFNLTEEDMQAYKEAAADFKACIDEGKGNTSTLLAMADFSALYSKIGTQYSVAYVNYCKNTTDEKAVSDYEFAFKAYNEANHLYRETLKGVLLSDSEFVETIFEGWTDDEKKMLLDNNEEVYRLNEKNEELLMEYRALDDKAEGWADAVDEIYCEIVKNNNLIAAEYGYSDYYSYASKLLIDRNYTAEDRENLRRYVKTYIVPLYKQNLEKVKELYSSADEKTVSAFDEIMGAAYPNNERVQGYISDYIMSFSGDLSYISYAMDAMFIPGRAVFANEKDSLTVAFTTYLSYFEEPVAYFGPGYHDALTVVHEMGHYAAFVENGILKMPIDFCEVHSQTNEWLFISYLEGKLDPKVHELLVLSRLVEGLEKIIRAVAVDECEERIYSAADADTPEEHAAIISEVMALYGEDICEMLKLERYFRYVASDNPVYYLSYAVSEIQSIENYLDSVEDFGAAQKAYAEFIEDSIDPAKTAEGLRAAFSEDTYKDLVERFAVESEDNEENETESEGSTVYAPILEWLLPAA